MKYLKTYAKKSLHKIISTIPNLSSIFATNFYTHPIKLINQRTTADTKGNIE
ncbi:hypothetical protein THIOSC13_1800011 [uncultured Thiomicrorhabdus sp.]